MKNTALLLAVAFILIFDSSQAQDAETDPSAPFIAARPIERQQPNYPVRDLMDGREGWVLLSVVVAEDGTVIEPMIEDSSGNEGFERAALRAIEDWVYEPATVDGEPVEQALTQIRMIFQQEETPQGASSRFQNSYNAISDSISAGDFEAASERLVDLQYSEKLNLYEDSWFWWINYLYHDASGSDDRQAMRESLQRAIGYGETYLTPDILLAAAQRQYVLQVQDGDVGAAIKTYDWLAESEQAQAAANFDEAVAAMSEHVQSVEDLVAGPSVLLYAGEIGRFDYWIHDLMRRSFSIESVEGELERVDIRCETGTQRYTWETEQDLWLVPAEWGECVLYLKGTVGTRFSLYEYPDEP